MSSITLRRILPVLAVVLAVSAMPAAQSQVRRPVKNVTVKLNEPQIIHTHWIQNSATSDPNAACRVIRPPTLVVKRKPKIGTVKIRKGVMIESGPRSPCKGKKVRGTTVEYTGTKRGADQIIVEVLYRIPGYYDHKFGEIEFRVRVR